MLPLSLWKHALQSVGIVTGQRRDTDVLQIDTVFLVQIRTCLGEIDLVFAYYRNATTDGLAL
jgi:hypothetical protein